MRVVAVLGLVLSILAIPVLCAVGESPQTRLPVTGTVLAVVSPCELDVMITRSSVDDGLEVGSVVRLVYRELVAPGRFDEFYMEAYDLHWILTSDREIFFEPASPIVDEEKRWPAYVYLDPNGFGLVSAFLLASGLVTIDPALEPENDTAQLLLDIAAAAEDAGIGRWAKPKQD